MSGFSKGPREGSRGLLEKVLAVPSLGVGVQGGGPAGYWQLIRLEPQIETGLLPELAFFCKFLAKNQSKLPCWSIFDPFFGFCRAAQTLSHRIPGISADDLELLAGK